MALEVTIAVFVVLAGLYHLLPAQWRGWGLFVVSAVAVYWLQPDIRIRWLDFFLPTLTLSLTVMTWFLTRAPEQAISTEDRIAVFITVGVILGLSLLRFVPAPYRILVASRPPDPVLVAGVVSLLFGTMLLINLIPQSQRILLFLLIGLFAVLKFEPLGTELSRILRAGFGQDATLASSLDLKWLGFSYVAFRLIHTVRDRQTGLLPALTLREYVTYITFFPAFLSGPIDRAERFIEDFRALPKLVRWDAARVAEGAQRIVLGLFKKFVLADGMAQGMALDAQIALQTENTIGAWVLLYGYALRLYFDFSGYTDIAIGVGIMLGFRLPENFNNPYVRTNITHFWQSWHISLSDWARFYVFSPLSRNLLRRRPKPSPTLIVLVSQLATMLVIGLWHGVTLNFVIWGIWHGIGLWLHKQWSDRTRKWYRNLNENPTKKRLWDVFAWFITFHYVVLGWVWFALPEVGQSLSVFGQLIGI